MDWVWGSGLAMVGRSASDEAMEGVVKIEMPVLLLKVETV